MIRTIGLLVDSGGLFLYLDCHFHPKMIAMKNLNPLRILSIVFVVTGLYDLSGVLLYAVSIGTGMNTIYPETNPFYALFIGSFLLCFAFLQFMSAFNIKRYLIIVGVVFIGRILYAVILLFLILLAEEFPTSIWWTGIIDTFWAMLYLILVGISKEVGIKNLFIPDRSK